MPRRHRPRPPDPGPPHNALAAFKKAVLMPDGEFIFTGHFEDRMAERNFQMGDVRKLAHEGRIYHPPEWDLRYGQHKWRVEGKALDGRTLYVVFVVLGENRVLGITIETPGR